MYKLVDVRRSPLPLGKGRPPLTPPLNYSLYTSSSRCKMPEASDRGSQPCSRAVGTAKWLGWRDMAQLACL